MPRSVFITTACLVILAACGGYWLGVNRTSLDESAAIEAVIERHVTRTGGLASECVAVPGEGDIWIRVICGDATYDLARNGRIVEQSGPQT